MLILVAELIPLFTFTATGIKNRKDAIRNAIQFEDATPMDISRSKGTDLFGFRDRRKEAKEDAVSQSQEDPQSALSNEAKDQRRLTRAAFSRPLQQHTERKSVFNVKGLHRLQETFHALDRSIGAGQYHPDMGGENSVRNLSIGLQ